MCSHRKQSAYRAEGIPKLPEYFGFLALKVSHACGAEAAEVARNKEKFGAPLGTSLLRRNPLCHPWDLPL